MSPNHRNTTVVLGGVIALAASAWSTFAGEGRVTMVENEGQEITIDSGGEAITSKISGSGTKVTINGADAKAEDVRVGMNCVTDVADSGDEATTFRRHLIALPKIEVIADAGLMLSIIPLALCSDEAGSKPAYGS